MPDLLTIVNSKLAALNIPASTLAALSNVSGGVLSTYLNGVKTAPSDQAMRIYEVATELEELVKMCAPVPVDFRQVNVLRDCLKSIKNGRLRIAVIKNDLIESHKSFVVRFKNGVYFTSRDKNNQVLSTINFLSAAKMTEDVAEELIRILKGLGYSCTAIENKFGESDPAVELSQVWQDQSSTIEAVQEATA
jgi:hypothetical protein